MRSAELRRQTGETDIYCWMDLDDPDGTCSVATGVGFFDHMLQLLAFHSGFGLIVKADGDLDVDAVEPHEWDKVRVQGRRVLESHIDAKTIHNDSPLSIV